MNRWTIWRLDIKSPLSKILFNWVKYCFNCVYYKVVLVTDCCEKIIRTDHFKNNGEWDSKYFFISKRQIYSRNAFEKNQDLLTVFVVHLLRIKKGFKNLCKQEIHVISKEMNSMRLVFYMTRFIIVIKIWLKVQNLIKF